MRPLSRASRLEFTEAFSAAATAAQRLGRAPHLDGRASTIRRASASPFKSLPERVLRTASAFLVACFLVFFSVTAFTHLRSEPVAPPPSKLAESWDPRLARVQSIDQAMQVLPSYIARQHGSRDARIASGVYMFVRQRFFHDWSYLTYRENWLAALSGLVWINLREPVLPDDILKHRRAICSQQAIVMIELLRQYGIRHAAVTMSWPDPDPAERGHFTVAALIDGRWMYFDPDQEPPVMDVPVDRVQDGTALQMLYGGKPDLLKKMNYAAAHGNIRMEHVDAFPAPNGGLFQEVTGFLSAYGWLVFGLLAGCSMAAARRFGGSSTNRVLAYQGR